MKKIIRLTESDLTRIVKRVIKEQKEQTNILTPDKINTLSLTSNDDGVSGMIKSGILTYTDEQGSPITIDLTSISGADNIRLLGNVNVDVNSSLFEYLEDYNITLTKSPQYINLISPERVLENVIDNSDDKFIQFVNPADEENTIVFIKTKSGNYEMLYLNVFNK